LNEANIYIDDGQEVNLHNMGRVNQQGMGNPG